MSTMTVLQSHADLEFLNWPIAPWRCKAMTTSSTEIGSSSSMPASYSLHGRWCQLTQILFNIGDDLGRTGKSGIHANRTAGHVWPSATTASK